MCHRSQQCTDLDQPRKNFLLIVIMETAPKLHTLNCEVRMIMIDLGVLYFSGSTKKASNAPWTTVHYYCCLADNMLRSSLTSKARIFPNLPPHLTSCSGIFALLSQLPLLLLQTVPFRSMKETVPLAFLWLNSGRDAAGTLLSPVICIWHPKGCHYFLVKGGSD